jgi:hypothetical protein
MSQSWSNLMFDCGRTAYAFAALGWPMLRDHVPVVELDV